MRIAYLTAGAAGMFCGSCLHDNALAKALLGQGHDVLLVPTYTPIRTDEANVSRQELFLGGLNVYLQQMSPVFRWLPKWADRLLSSPRLVNWVATKSMGTTADKLGALTVSMLKGADGFQRKEVARLCDWLQRESPDVVVFSNLLIAGCIAEVKRRIASPVVVILQGDDIFYEGLPEPFRKQALIELRKLSKQVDRFVVHSRDYGLRMQEMLGFADEQLAINPLGIDVSDFHLEPSHSVQSKATDDREDPERLRIGYLARLAPEKGLDVLVDAFIELSRDHPKVELHLAGWLGSQHREYWQQQQDKLKREGLENRYRYWGEVDRSQKLEFLRHIDVLSVPAPYKEPKGLFVLEALASGVPYVQPAHGAFPELHDRLQGGVLFPMEGPSILAETLSNLLKNPESLFEMGRIGRERVHELASTEKEAETFATILRSLIDIEKREDT